jgi:hypothetical protein
MVPNTNKWLSLFVCLFALHAPFASAATKTWIPNGGGNWSDPSNWSPAGPPVSGDFLSIGTLYGPLTNDLPGTTTIGGMELTGYGVTFDGNPMRLTGHVLTTSTCDGCRLIWNDDLTIASPLTFSLFHGDLAWTATFNGALTVDSEMTTGGPLFVKGPLHGSGSILAAMVDHLRFSISGGGDFSGSIVMGPSQYPNWGFGLYVNGSLPNATIVTGELTGNGVVGDVTILMLGRMHYTGGTAGAIMPGDADFDQPFGSPPPAGVGVFQAKSLTLLGAGGYYADVGAAGGDQIQVNGHVKIAAPLLIRIFGTPPAPGQAFTIIDNRGSEPIEGAFDKYIPGAYFNQGAYYPIEEGSVVKDSTSTKAFRISYHGGDGNDVVLFALGNTSTTLAQSAAASAYGESVTFTGNVSVSDPAAGGTVTFSDGNTILGTAPLQSGVATLTTAALDVGTHQISAAYSGYGSENASSSVPVSHMIAPASTVTTLNTVSTATYGDVIHFAVNVGAQPPGAVAPSGSVTILENGVPVVTAPVANGAASIDSSALHAGTRSVQASFSANAHYFGSASVPATLAIAKAVTTVDARVPLPPLIGSASTLTVLVTSVSNGAVVTSGVVSLGEGTAIFDQQRVVNGSVRLNLPPLSGGDHKLTVTYAGNDDFASSSSAVTLTVHLPSLSISGADVLEGNGATTTVMVPVTLTPAVNVPVRVSFATLAGSATEGIDYEKASGVVEFAPGETTRSIELHVIGDSVFEDDETFSIVLSDPVNAVIATPSATVVIENDDHAPARHRPARH